MNTAIIFGLASAGVYLLRELSKANVKVICIIKKSDIGRFTKYGVKYIVENEEDMRRTINEIVENCKDRPTGFIASAYYLTLILEKTPELFDLIDINGSDIELLRVLEDKRKAYKKLTEFNIPFPKTYMISDFESISEDDFPLIAKWSSTELNNDEKVISKTKTLSDRSELFEIVKHIDVQNSRLILQKYINDKSSLEYGYGGYFSKGNKIVDIFINQLRQYPMGISTFAREVEENEFVRNIKIQLNKMLSELNYNGFIQFDIKVNPCTKEYYVLDVNPRPWGSMKILKKKYPDFVWYFVNQDINITEREGIVQWVNLIRDFIAILYRAFINKSIFLIFKDYHEYFKNSMIFDLIQLNDLGIIIGFFNNIFLKLKRHFKI